jgi:hypothetical protein
MPQNGKYIFQVDEVKQDGEDYREDEGGQS